MEHKKPLKGLAFEGLFGCEWRNCCLPANGRRQAASARCLCPAGEAGEEINLQFFPAGPGSEGQLGAAVRDRKGVRPTNRPVFILQIMNTHAAQLRRHCAGQCEFLLFYRTRQNLPSTARPVITRAPGERCRGSPVACGAGSPPSIVGCEPARPVKGRGRIFSVSRGIDRKNLHPLNP